MRRWSTGGPRRISVLVLRAPKRGFRIPSLHHVPLTVTTASQGAVPTISRSFHANARSLLPRKPKPVEPTPVTNYAPLPPPDQEQKAILQTFSKEECNFIVDACAGAGKTTLILRLAHDNPHLRFLIFSYNNGLIRETKARAEKLGLKNSLISTYHALGYQHYSRECKTDMGLKRVVQNDMPLKGGDELQNFDVVVMDEMQDMTPVMKQFIDKLWRDMDFKHAAGGGERKPPRIVTLGDRRQAIYDFNNADPRFLTLANYREIFGYLNDYPWVEMAMSKSNRCPPKITAAVNMLIPSPHPISSAEHAGMKDIRPDYIVISPENPEPLIAGILKLLEKYTPEEILLLAPSTRNSSVIKKLLNTLVKAPYNLPIHVPNSEYEIDPECANGKIICSTFHQAKGIQRKAVFVFHFDESYHRWYNRNPDSTEYASNTLYVAGTRATERLMFVQSNEQNPLPFVDMQEVTESHENGDLEYTEHDPPRVPEEFEGAARQPRFAVTNLLRNLSDECTSNCLARLEVTEMDPPRPYTEPPAKVPDVYGLKESVSEISGTAAVSIYMNRIRLAPFVLPAERSLRGSFLKDLPDRYKARIRRIRSDFKKASEERPKVSLQDLLFLANIHCAYQSGLIHKVVSIPNNGYRWLDAIDEENIFQILNKYISKDSKRIDFEEPFDLEMPDINVPANDSGKPLLLAGAPDILDLTNNHIIEVKYTATFAPKDALQVAIYTEMAKRKHNKVFTSILVSAKTGQRFNVKPKSEDAVRIIIQNLINHKGDERIIDGPEKKLKRTTDEEFLAEARGGFKERVLPVTLPESFGMLPREVEQGSRELTLQRLKRRGKKGKVQ